MARKTGLGRGLDALIPGGESEGPPGGVHEISVDSITPNPLQPRTNFDESELVELAASIREHGIIQPLIVSRADGANKYILIAGERRWKAALLAGLARVPAIIREATDLQRLELALIENVQRADLAPLETADAYRQLSEDFGLTHEQIAARVGKSRVSVSNTLRLLNLSPMALEALANGKISEGHGRALLGLKSPQAQSAALQTLLKNDLSVRQTETLVERLNAQPVEKTRKETRDYYGPEIRALESRLEAALGTRVELKRTKKGGAVVIHYYSEEELDALVGRLSGDSL